MSIPFWKGTNSTYPCNSDQLRYVYSIGRPSGNITIKVWKIYNMEIKIISLVVDSCYNFIF